MKPLDNDLTNILRKIFSRRGKVFAEIMINWSRIVGIQFSDGSWPYKISSYTEAARQINVLYVYAESSAISIGIVYQKGVILERIAVYFGAKLIDNLNVKVIGNYASK